MSGQSSNDAIVASAWNLPDSQPTLCWSNRIRTAGPTLVLIAGRAGLQAELSWFHSLQDVSVVDAQLVKTHVVEAEIRGWRMQRPQCTVAE